MDQHGHGIQEYLNVVRRRKWIALGTIVLVAGVAYLASHFESAKYRASAEVLLSRNLASSLSNVPDPNQGVSPDRLAQTQADLARVPTVIDRALAAAHVRNVTPGQFAASSSVTAKSDADLLDFTYTAAERRLAARLATQYARQYILYRKELDTQALSRARSQVQARIAELQKSGDHNSALYASLVERDQQLATMQALQTSNSTLVKAAQGASQVQPRPVRNTVLAAVLGIVLGLALAFLRDTLDTRVRSTDDITRALKLPLLARVPAPSKALSSADRLVMVAEPLSAGAEPFRVLRTNLEFVNLERKAHKIVVTSGLEGEGKSTTAANLAVALARSGEHVVLVDLDLRRPYLHRFFGMEDTQSLAQVALGRTQLEDALSSVALTDWRRPASPAENGTKTGGILEVLATGPLPPNPGEFSGSQVVGDILNRLARRATYVLIDTAPLIGVGDTLALSRWADAMILVTRLNRLRKPMLKELGRLLGGTPVDVLGFVVTEAEAEDQYAYGYYRYGYGRSRGTGDGHEWALREEVAQPARSGGGDAR